MPDELPDLGGTTNRWVRPTDAGPFAGVLSGSFNPLHQGHITLAAVAAQRLCAPIHFELSITNVDKPELPPAEVERRVNQFQDVGPVWVTRAATFAAKAELFPGKSFVLGYDTAVRLIDSKYYAGEAGRDACLRKLLACGCRVIVGGRVDASGQFRTWSHASLPHEFTALFVALTEEDFRVDLSSTQLRNR